MREKRSDTSRRQQQSGAAGKKAYSRPRVILREPLEVVAAACQPAPPGKANNIDCSQLTS